MSQVHKRFTPDQVKELLERYTKNEIERKYIQEILGIKKRRFFILLKAVQRESSAIHDSVPKSHPFTNHLTRDRAKYPAKN